MNRVTRRNQHDYTYSDGHTNCDSPPASHVNANGYACGNRDATTYAYADRSREVAARDAIA